MKPFTAELESIGEWQGQEQEAVDCWNRWVAPALAALDEQLGESDSADAELGYAREAAWEQFCDTTDAESFPELGQRVASMVNGWLTQFCTR
jgi:hypothetical protein